MSAPPAFRLYVGRKRSADDHETNLSSSDQSEISKMQQYFEKVKMAKTAASENNYRKSVQELDEALRVAKRGRVLSFEEEKKLRRTLSNQRSVKKTRLKRIQYVGEMEKKITELKEAIGSLTPAVQNLKQANTMLKIEKAMLEGKIKRWTDYTNSVDAQIEERKAEIRMLMKNITEVESYSTETYPVPESYSQLSESCSGVCRQPEPGPVEDTDVYLNLDALCELTYI